MLTKCLKCGFYVRPEEEFCPNCGISAPTESLDRKLKRWSFLYRLSRSRSGKLAFSLVCSFIVLYWITELLLARFILYREYTLLGGFILWLGLFLTLFLYSRNRHFSPGTPRLRKKKNSLIAMDKTINKRVAELNLRCRKIEAVLENIKETDGLSLQTTRARLLSARAVILRQLERYELQRYKIELVRLQNSVSPFLFNLQRLNEAELTDGLSFVENMQRRTSQLRKKLSPQEKSEGFESEHRQLLTQVEETIESGEKLREALLGRQATRALEDLSPIVEALIAPDTNELAQAAEAFNIQASLTDFSESFEELEREYRRLRTESETRQQLLEA